MLWPGLNARPPAVGVSCCPLNGLVARQILVLFHHVACMRGPGSPSGRASLPAGVDCCLQKEHLPWVQRARLSCQPVKALYAAQCWAEPV